jgi:hypothetical protein
MSYIGNPIVSTDFPVDTFSGNGSTTAFTLTQAPASVNAIIVAVSGVLQEPSTYTISGTTLTFTAAPPSGTSNISVRHLGVAGIPNTPVAGSVQYSSLNSSLQGTLVGRNRIINGAMVIDQRNAGASVTVNGNSPFITDRFRCDDATDGAYTAQQVSTAPDGFTNSVQVTVTSADTSLSASQYALFYHSIEGNNVADLGWGTSAAKTITLSFWVRSSLTGTFSGSLENNANNRSYIFTYAINAANTWEQKTITIVGDTSGTWEKGTAVGIRINWSLGVGSDFLGTAGAWGNRFFGATGSVSLIGTNSATWNITGVQLEVGSTATSFDYRPYGTELALCQRYFYQATGASGNGYEGFATGTADASTSADVIAQLPVTMRAIPTTSFAGTIYIYDGGVTPTLSSVASVFGGKTGVYLNLTTSSGLTVGRGVIVYTNNATTNNFAFSAEL